MPAAPNKALRAPMKPGPGWLKRLLAWVSKGAAQMPPCQG